MAPTTLNVLIGDIIRACRSAIPDKEPTLPAPTSSFSVVSATGSTLPAGTYSLKVTQRNPWGETLPATESTGQVVAGNQGIQVTSALLPGATAIRAYLTLAGGAAGSEIQFIESATSPFTISTPPPGMGQPPTISTAYMPDSDGNAFGASTLYAWLNEGLKKLSRATGGIMDYSGVPTIVGQPMYVLTGEWLEIDSVWYGGYWVKGGRVMDFFRRNAVTTSILSGVAISVFADKQVIEVSYQPDRNSGTTTTTAGMLATDTSVTWAANTFLLPFGFVQLGTGAGAEICAYSKVSGASISGLIRGLGTTSAFAWPSGTTVTELSLFWHGRRVHHLAYAPGNALTPLPVPVGWEAILPLYMIGRAREVEQDRQTAKSLYDQFFAEAKDWLLSNKGVQRFVQVGEQSVPDARARTVAGGLIVP